MRVINPTDTVNSAQLNFSNDHDNSSDSDLNLDIDSDSDLDSSLDLDLLLDGIPDEIIDIMNLMLSVLQNSIMSNNSQLQTSIPGRIYNEKPILSNVLKKKFDHGYPFWERESSSSSQFNTLLTIKEQLKLDTGKLCLEPNNIKSEINTSYSFWERKPSILSHSSSLLAAEENPKLIAYEETSKLTL